MRSVIFQSDSQKIRPNSLAHRQKAARLHSHIVANQATDPIEGIEDRTDMTNTRFIKSVTTAAKSDTTAMPWARGKRRAAFIAKRKCALPPAKSA